MAPGLSCGAHDPEVAERCDQVLDLSLASEAVSG